MPDHLGDDMRKVRPEEKEEEIKCKCYLEYKEFFVLNNLLIENDFPISLIAWCSARRRRHWITENLCEYQLPTNQISCFRKFH